MLIAERTPQGGAEGLPPDPERSSVHGLPLLLSPTLELWFTSKSGVAVSYATRKE